ncbi:PQQ-binding-like beta-propeller repeat protein [Planctomycetota bacterium]
MALEDLEILWSVTFSDEIETQQREGDVMVVSTEMGDLFGIDTDTGEELWTYSFLHDRVNYVIDEGVVFARGGIEGIAEVESLTAIHAETGELLWQSPVDEITQIKDPILFEDQVILWDKWEMYRYDKRIGIVVSRIDIDELADIDFIELCALYRGNLIGTSSGGTTFSIDLKTKKVNWNIKTHIDFYRYPVEIYDQVIFYFMQTETPWPPGIGLIGGFDYDLRALDLVTGEGLWDFDKWRDYPTDFALPGKGVFQPKEQPIIVTMKSGKRYALNSKTGKMIDMPAIPLGMIGYDGVIYAADEEGLSAYEAQSHKVMKTYRRFEGKLVGVDERGFYWQDGNTINYAGVKK